MEIFSIFVDFFISPIYFKYLKVYNEDPERARWQRKGGYEMEREQVIEKMEKLVQRAIKEEDFRFIRAAERIALACGIYLSIDEEYVEIEDEVFQFNGIKF